MATREATQFAFRAQKEMGVCNAPPASTAAVALPAKPTEEVRSLAYSANGQRLAWSVADHVHIADAHSLAAVAQVASPGILDVRFSPKGTYLITWERLVRAAGAEPTPNLKVWDAATGELRGSFVQSSFATTALQWTDDEKYCAKLFPGQVRFYTPEAMSKAALTLKLEGVAAFSVSPGLSPSVAVFVPERKSKPALVRMYSLGSFTSPVANKSFFKAEKVEFFWHRLGTNVLVLTQTDVDKTGRSYYGESSLYFMAAAGNFDCRVPLDREGPIHDVAWSPTDKEFAVVYGFMPAKAALFNHRVEVTFDFGVAPRNFVRFNPHGRVVALAGFGNLSGQVDMWDRKTLKKLCSVDAHGASFCEWGPDGRYLMAATLSPRLRVDNGIRIWHYSGALVYNKEISELYQVDWRPAPASLFPQRSALSPVPDGIALAASSSSEKDAKPAGAYRPPHARSRNADNNSPRSLYDMAEQKSFGGAATQRTVPGAAPKLPVGASPNAVSNSSEKKRRRNRKKSSKNDADTDADKASEKDAGPNASAPASDAPPATDIDVLKKIRQLNKKLVQIETLTKKRDQGESLEDNQISKIESRPQIESEIATLTARLSNLPPS
ncbi:hypothetical protein IW140_005046 [Coemansia sp. RSA 1813]|nr:hypothetical protein LPJ74_003862 [Coemansia sp. RSA 1843]KAJ2087284.1 hypothetical protein IW138_005064 [Coemansia sp. RSA 986]KAJ2212165.1 hypothetical protein EV179_004901 [Coemansia sp. RSA 487]KAJ2566178.1 hypothetical protein IW140_005046 [Coemansia sp. RSA 1813]